MLKKVIATIILFVIIICTESIYSQIIPASSIGDWSNAGIPGGIPDYPVQHSVLDFGAAGDGVTDDTEAIKAAINATTPGYALYFPEGTFLVTSTFTIRKGILLRGAGPSKTLIHSKHDAITFWLWGNGDTEITTFAAQAATGSREFQVTSAQGIEAGDFLKLERQDGAKQIAVVEQVSGNQINISGVLYGDFTEESIVSRLNNVVEGAGVEDMKIFIDRPEGGSNGTTKIRMSGIVRSWVKNIETRGVSYEVEVNGCFQCEVRDNYFYNPVEDIISRITGFGSYGVMVVNGTSESLIENNVLNNYRHSLPTTDIIGGNVFGYNYSSGMWDGVPIARSTIIGDMELHHGFGESILMEGNCIEYIRFDGAAGYLKNWNVALRNRTTLSGIAGWSDTGINYIIGNELPPVKIELGGANNSIGSGMDASLVHGNYISYQDKGISWDPTISDHNIPNSYYLTEKPEWFGDLVWPPYGGDLMETGGGYNPNRIPAEVRYWTTRFPENAPTDLSLVKLNETTVKIDWNSNSVIGTTSEGTVDSIDFIIVRSTDGINFERIASTKQTAYTDANLTPGQQYWYYVRARNYVSVIEDGTDQAWSGPGGESDPSETITIGGTVSVEKEKEIPTIFSLSQNYPNPFNPVTTIKYSIPTSPLNPSPYQGEGQRERFVQLKIYNLLGQEVVSLVNKQQPAGYYKVKFDGSNLASGVYLYKLTAGEFVSVKKFVLMK